MPVGHKNMLKGLVRSHFQDKETRPVDDNDNNDGSTHTYDLVRDKGLRPISLSKASRAEYVQRAGFGHTSSWCTRCWEDLDSWYRSQSEDLQRLANEPLECVAESNSKPLFPITCGRCQVK